MECTSDCITQHIVHPVHYDPGVFAPYVAMTNKDWEKYEPMTDEDWKKVSYFKKEEKWGDPYKMDRCLIFLLDYLRDRLGKPVIITSGYRAEESPSQHHAGKAADFKVPSIGYKELVDSILSEFKALGIEKRARIGIYPNTEIIHIDTMGEKGFTGKLTGRWGYIGKDKNPCLKDKDYVSFKDAYKLIK